LNEKGRKATRWIDGLIVDGQFGAGLHVLVGATATYFGCGRYALGLKRRPARTG
jgi:hypothetical protein